MAVVLFFVFGWYEGKIINFLMYRVLFGKFIRAILINTNIIFYVGGVILEVRIAIRIIRSYDPISPCQSGSLYRSLFF